MYLDPALGGMLLQVVVAIAAVSGAFLFSIRKKIRSLFKKGKGPEAPAGSAASGASADDAIDMLENEERQ
ncbi:MAG: hypothetical protein LBI54_06905 [Lachnospiraceae bacterium]|jgi:hypothetical protein|nr:hypothetical protein [Lachnospiraceae bacterium]